MPPPSDETDAPILVVDADPHLREALARLLEGEGHRVLTAADGDAAARIADELPIGLLVLEHDEAMVGAVRRTLRAEPPPTLLLTTRPDRLARAADPGVFGLAKPFAVRDLLAAVDRHRRRLVAVRE